MVVTTSASEERVDAKKNMIDPHIHSSRFCIHQVTMMEQCSFQQFVECLARHGIDKAAIWRPKLDQVGVSLGKKLLEDHGIDPVALCAAVLLGDVPTNQCHERVECNRKIIEQAAAIGAPSVIVITGGLAAYGRDIAGARAMCLEILGELGRHARDLGINLILEPLHPMVCGNRSVISTLQEANLMLNAIDMDDVLGIALDTYALWWQSDLESQIKEAGSRISHFHVSDWLPDTKDVRLDRGMPGDGLIDNREIRHWLEATGFNGPVEVEIFSKRDWWTRPEDEVVSVIRQRYETCL